MAAREAIKGGRVLAFRYLSRFTGRQSWQRVAPHGLLYGGRGYLVGRSDWTEDMRYRALTNMSEVRMTGVAFEFDEGFDLRDFARRSFGVFQEEPVDVTLRFDAKAAEDAAAYLFHPGQETTRNDDGTLTVRFRAGGTREMCWHLFTWGRRVTVGEPESLKRELAEMCARLAGHHGVELC